MERVTDGRGYHRVLGKPGRPGRVAVISDHDRFLVAVGDSSLDFQEYAGAPLGEAIAAVAGKDVFTFSVEDVDRFREEGLAAAHMHEETAGWRAHLPSRVQDPPHFLVRLFEGRLAKLLPSAFGMLIVFDRQTAEEAREFPRAFLLTFRRGKLESFYEPDFESLDARNTVSVGTAAKQMGTRHAMKVEAIVICPDEWRAINAEPSTRLAWKRFSTALRNKRARLVPFRLMLSSVIFLKGL